MESVSPTVLSVRPSCKCGDTFEDQPKILRSILSYHLNNYDLPLVQDCRRGSTCSSSRCSSPREGSSPTSSGYHTPSPQLNLGPKPQNYRLYNILKGSGSSNCSHSSGYSSSTSSPPLNEDQPLNLKRGRISADEPMDLSCKRPSKRLRAVSESSDFSFASTREESPHSDVGSSIDLSGASSPCSRWTDSPMTMGSSSCPKPELELSNSVINTPKSNSILESILRGKISSELTSHKGDLTTPTTENERLYHYTHHHRDGRHIVVLAKKNLLPVSARVSDWLVKIVQFAKSIPEFMVLSYNDEVQLLLSSWCRLMLLYMAETNFQFAVTLQGTESLDSSIKLIPPEIPTMKSVEGVQNFIKKCQNLNMDAQEYTYLRMLILFNHGFNGLENSTYVDNMNSYIRQCLQDHIWKVGPTDKLRYSRVLLCLPNLFGINCKMVEKLFCKHISSNMDVEVLLKDMLQKL